MEGHNKKDVTEIYFVRTPVVCSLRFFFFCVKSIGMYTVGWSKRSSFVSAKALCNQSTTILNFRLRKALGDDEDWQSARDIIEEFYIFCKNRVTPVSRSMDASRMVTVNTVNAIKWVSLFLKHRETTKQLLVCSCLITTNANVKLAMDSFLKLYDPIKPFRVVSDSQNARKFVESVSFKTQ